MSYGHNENFQLSETRQRAAPPQTDPAWLETTSGYLTMPQLPIHEPGKLPFLISPTQQGWKGDYQWPQMMLCKTSG